MTIEIELPETAVLPLDEIKPYWRNPRRIPPEAVAAVRDSIERYGYQQPIVVDSDGVIVVGHTRYEALRQMGVQTTSVYVARLSADKIREYRLIDNRTSELSSWDHDALVLELREWETGLLERYFPEVDLEIGAIDDAMVTMQDVDRAVEKVTKVREAQVAHTTRVVCPSCLHSFEVRTDSLPGSGNDARELTTDGEAE